MLDRALTRGVGEGRHRARVRGQRESGRLQEGLPPRGETTAKGDRLRVKSPPKAENAIPLAALKGEQQGPLCLHREVGQPQ